MRWFLSTHKAIRRFLISHQSHLHVGSDSGSRTSHALNSIGYRLKSTDLPIFGDRYSTSTIPESRSINNGNMHGNTNDKKVDLEIISRETIKPAFPTPNHLRTFNLSIIDQVMFDCYTPLVLFLPNNDKATVTDVVTKRSKHLKQTLSEILTRFYHVAGEVKDNLHVECIDKGVYFVVARVDQTLEEFLGHHPDDHKMRELVPENFGTLQSSIGNYVAGIQVNVFNCGGIGLCTSLAHKIFDGHTYFMFMKAWAAALRGSPETISPDFVGSRVFPNNPSLKDSMPSKLMTTKSLSTKRFFFDPAALALLKAQPVGCPPNSSVSLPAQVPTRMEATTSLIWKAAAKAASTVRPFGPHTPHVLSSLVNLRKRASPPLPYGSVGNIVMVGVGICFPESQPDLPTLMWQMRESIAKINPDFVESMKDEKGHEVIKVILRMINDLTEGIDEGDCLFATGLLNSGIYDIDFGWGKPVWFYNMNAGFCRFVSLNDTIKGRGGGVEAIVTLSSNEMEIFERDPEVLSYATVNPSPLQYLHD